MLHNHLFKRKKKGKAEEFRSRRAPFVCRLREREREREKRRGARELNIKATTSEVRGPSGDSVFSF